MEHDRRPPSRTAQPAVDWDALYRTGETRWDKGAPSPVLRQYLTHQQLHGRALVPGCGRGHDVALAHELGLDAIGLDIAPTAVAQARARYPHLADRFRLGNVFDPPADLRGAFEIVLEHTCMSALPPTWRADYRRGIDSTLRRGGLLIGVWYINPALDPAHEGPPYPFSLEDLTALFADAYAVVDDAVPTVAFPSREGRERLRVLRRVE